MTITDHIEALDLTLEAADGSDTITLAYATVEELRDTLAWCQDKLEHFACPPPQKDVFFDYDEETRAWYAAMRRVKEPQI